MAITERDRHTLYQRLEELLGEEEATTLMEHLPPVGWADVATKTDLQNLEYRLESKIDQSTLSLHREFNAFSADIRTEFATFKDEMRGDFSGFKNEFHLDRLRAQRQTIFVLAAVIVSIIVSIVTSF